MACRNEASIANVPTFRNRQHIKDYTFLSMSVSQSKYQVETLGSWTNRRQSQQMPSATRALTITRVDYSEAPALQSPLRGLGTQRISFRRVVQRTSAVHEWARRDAIHRPTAKKQALFIVAKLQCVSEITGQRWRTVGANVGAKSHDSHFSQVTSDTHIYIHMCEYVIYLCEPELFTRIHIKLNLKTHLRRGSPKALSSSILLASCKLMMKRPEV